MVFIDFIYDDCRLAASVAVAPLIKNYIFSIVIISTHGKHIKDSRGLARQLHCFICHRMALEQHHIIINFQKP